MKTVLFYIFFTALSTYLSAQNLNLSGGQVFDGEPFLAVDPSNPQHMVAAWMGYVVFNKIVIKTKATFDGGKTWSNMNFIPHARPEYGSADPSMAFDNNGNLFLCYVDYDTGIDSGSVFVVKSADGGLTWGNPVEVIHAHADEGKYPVDRPWISIDRSGGNFDGFIYVTTMPPNVFGPLPPPYHPYFIRSTDGGTTFDPWRYLDTVNWLAGSVIPQPMATHDVSIDGTFYAAYPSYVMAQNLLAQFILAATTDGGDSFSYHTIFASGSSVTDSLAKKGYLLRCDPADPAHLVLFYLDVPYGDIDVFMRESYDQGISWSGSVKINDDPAGNDRMQDLLWADFDADGDLAVTWRDRRNGTAPGYETASEIRGAFRKKDSTHFSPSFMISDMTIPYDTVLALNGNDFMCTQLVNDTLNVVWGDPRNGTLNIWFQRMAIDGSVVSKNRLSDENQTNIVLYPNPVVDILHIKGDNIQEADLYSIHGKHMFAEKNNQKNNELTLNLKHFAAGVYIVRLKTLQGIISGRIIKK